MAFCGKRAELVVEIAIGLLAVVRPPVRVLAEGNLVVEQKKNGKINFHFLNLFKMGFKFPQRARSLSVGYYRVVVCTSSSSQRRKISISQRRDINALLTTRSLPGYRVVSQSCVPHHRHKAEGRRFVYIYIYIYIYIYQRRELTLLQGFIGFHFSRDRARSGLEHCPPCAV